MIKKITHFFKINKKETPKYKGFSDFFMNASPKDKKAIITEAAHQANNDQLKIFNKVNTRSCPN